MKHFHIFSSLIILIFISLQTQAQTERVIPSDNYNYTENDTAAEYFEKGNYYFDKGRLIQAEKYYKLSIEADSEFVEAYDNLGLTYRHMSELDSAAKYYQISIQLYPEGDMALQNLGVVYEKQKRYEEAIDIYTKLIAQNESNPEGYYGRARMYIFIEEYDAALKDALIAEDIYKAMESKYVMDAHYIIGLIYYFLDDVENSKLYLLKAKDEGVDVPQSLLDAVGADTNPR
ncbi:MAG: hypothetical protein C0592_11470 [Marinilabiliales bacterium]|nr:MAG: hypothetical protein C0592_11470 [Marinilabiliales bacterium]